MLKGGKKIGEGIKGYVNDVAYIKGDHNTLYYDLNNNKYKYLKLYGINKGKHIIKEYEINKIINIIKDRNDLIVKKFTNNLWFIGNTSKFNFKNELAGYLEIIKIFGNNIKKYTAIKPLGLYKRVNIYGLSTKRHYYTFAEKCNNTLDNIKLDQKLFNQFIEDILNVLKLLKKNHYLHNDLKPDNMMYCNNTFKLIDWELSRMIKNKPDSIIYGGTAVFNHPIKYYLKGMPAFICKNLMDIEIYVYNKHKWIGKLKCFNEYKKRTLDSFDRILKLNLSSEKMHKLFTKYFDNYAFALNIAFLAEKNKLKPPQELINKLMKPLEYPIIK